MVVVDVVRVEILQRLRLAKKKIVCQVHAVVLERAGLTSRAEFALRVERIVRISGHILLVLNENLFRRFLRELLEARPQLVTAHVSGARCLVLVTAEFAGVERVAVLLNLLLILLIPC